MHSPLCERFLSPELLVVAYAPRQRSGSAQVRVCFGRFEVQRGGSRGARLAEGSCSQGGQVDWAPEGVHGAPGWPKEAVHRGVSPFYNGLGRPQGPRTTGKSVFGQVAKAPRVPSGPNSPSIMMRIKPRLTDGTHRIVPVFEGAGRLDYTQRWYDRMMTTRISGGGSPAAG